MTLQEKILTIVRMYNPMSDYDSQMEWEAAQLQALYRTHLEKEMLEIVERAKPKSLDEYYPEATVAIQDSVYDLAIIRYHTQLLNIIKGGK